MTWKVVTEPKDSSHITHCDIYLDAVFYNRTNLKDYGTLFIVTGLKQDTNYKVGIATVDGSSQRSIIKYSEFMTTEAGKFEKKTRNRHAFVAYGISVLKCLMMHFFHCTIRQNGISRLN